MIKDYLPFLKVGGNVIVMCPQEKGFASDPTHVSFLHAGALRAMLESAGLSVDKTYSFPFPRYAGKLFRYNEFVVTGHKTQQ